jgi:AbrB family looped-hinge helix DNA binding protein
LRVTSKGQVTIPVRIRRKLRIRANTQVDFIERDGEVVLEVREPEEKQPGGSLAERMAGKWQGELTTEEVMRLTRGEEWPSGPL